MPWPSSSASGSTDPPNERLHDHARERPRHRRRHAPAPRPRARQGRRRGGAAADLHPCRRPRRVVRGV
ncbi:MAG: hypothetical protein ACK55I_00345, partial [bacterium]